MDKPVVTVKQGKLRGVTEWNVLGSSFYYAFRGIPYAAPPVGNLRFREPRPPAPWSGIRDASKNGNVCAQMEAAHKLMFLGSEDCLYLNVYTPSFSALKPVTVYVHGGIFLMGSGDDEAQRPDYLITKDIVFVSINYRLGPLGFLNLEHKVAPGNQGLRDVIAALIWVKENITNFGGDPNNITIMGHSAGAVLAHCLCISPAGKGLFHKAILHSGLITQGWSKITGGSKYSYKLASILGFTSTDPTEVVKFLRSVSARQLSEGLNNLYTVEDRNVHVLPFMVNLDPFAETPLFPRSFEDLIENCRDIPIMVGATAYEFLMLFKGSDAEVKRFGRHISGCLKYIIPNASDAKVTEITERLKKDYFDENPVTPENTEPALELLTALKFTKDTERFVKKRINMKCEPTYYYRFSYIGNQKCITDFVVKKRAIHVASHMDDAAYLFYLPQCKLDDPEPPAEGTQDRILIERLTRMWTNFMKTGNPTPVLDEYLTVPWLPSTNDNQTFLDINNELSIMPMNKFHKREYNFDNYFKINI